MASTTGTTPLPTAERQNELRARRAANLKAERPPYAWTRLDAADIAWLITEHGWTTDETPGERVDLRQANLVRVDLHGQRLRFARFEGAILYGADLRDADLFYAHFTGSDLRDVNAEGAQLNMARMRGARLSGANLTRAQLRQSWLAKADLANARLVGADLSGAHLDHADFHEALLEGANLGWALLTEADLRSAHLAGADLRSAHLERALLDTADLRGARLEGAWCDEATFFGAHLESADLRNARLHGAQLAGASLAGTRLAGIDLSGVDLTRLADRDAFLTRPTGDERAAHQQTGSDRAPALRSAADGLDQLAVALTPAEGDRRAARRLHARAQALRRAAWRATGTPTDWLQWLGRSLAYGVIGNGDAPGRVALWAAILVALVAGLALVLPGAPSGTNLGSALVLSLQSFTTAGYGAFASQTRDALTAVGALESILGDLLTALFIAAVVRRTQSGR